MSKKRFTQEEKYEIIMAYYNREYSIAEIEKHYRVSRKTIDDWRHKYEKVGIEGLKKSEGWKGYSKDLKLGAVSDYLSGSYSLKEIVLKYGISSKSVLLNWIRIYNGRRKFKASRKGMGQSMTKGRATTMEKRIEIAKDCLEHG